MYLEGAKGWTQMGLEGKGDELDTGEARGASRAQEVHATVDPKGSNLWRCSRNQTIEHLIL